MPPARQGSPRALRSSKACCRAFPSTRTAFDAVLSKDLLHHLPDPSVLWDEVRRLGRSGAAVYVMDLIRPDTADAAREIVETVAGEEDPTLRQDFFNSLCAAFTIEEAIGQLRVAGLDHLEVTRSGDRTSWCVASCHDPPRRSIRMAARSNTFP
jgi:SAM-dependent methyltransferase